MKVSGPRCGGGGEPKRKRKPSSVRRSLEYPCVSRLRRRRLLAYLSRHGFDSTFQSLLQETTVFFSVDHLQRLARQGRWFDAIKYAGRFVPGIEASLGDEGRLFFSFINLQKTIDCIATSKSYGAMITRDNERELRVYPNVTPGALRRIRLLVALHRNDKLRAAIDWQLVRDKAAEIAKDLIDKTPEFNDLLRLPNFRDKPHNILPIRSCTSSRRRHPMKEGDRIPASDLTKFYLKKKRSLLPSSSQFEGSSLGIPCVPVSGLSCKASTLLANILDESVKAGLRRVVRDGHPFENSCNEGIAKRKREPLASCNNAMMEVSGSAKHKRVRHSLDYPCVSRLRHRRLLAFLLQQGFKSTFQAFAQETSVFFNVAHLKHLVFHGQWDDAIKYVYRFTPSVEMLGDVGNLFFSFLHTLRVLNCMATGKPCGVVMVEHCLRNLKKYPNSHLDSVKLNKMFVAMLRSKQLQVCFDWYRVRYKAAEIANDFITKTPEFNDLVRLPNYRDRPHHILPLGSCSHPRHHIKERSRIPASDLAGFYLQKNRSPPSSSQCEGNPSGVPCKASLSTWLVDSVDESVKAGIRHRVVRQAHPFEDPCNEGLKRTGSSSLQDSYARNNPKRSLATACQEFNPERQPISGVFGKHAGSIFEAHHSLGNAGARGVQSNMKSLVQAVGLQLTH